MCLKIYDSSFDFVVGTSRHSIILQSAYVRKASGLKSLAKRLTVQRSLKNPLSSGSLRVAVLNSIPILGTIRGLACLYSIWGVKDNDESSKCSLAIHTSFAILETLGLGIVVLLIRIVITALIRLAYVLTAPSEEL
ncbi:hypothetical protein [Chlamydia vaughanii]|uniref:hypothetical protein n=1 Tax=Chlamydia vaughanii TaxID=3112552 RepID=UPI0032B29EFB